MYGEITGFSSVLRDREYGGEPTGLKTQISKKWQSASTRQNYEAGYGGATTWATFNLFVRLPPRSHWSGDFAVAYNRYGGVPSFSHAQLSITGYTDAWTWHEAALASLGENICFDPLGTHTRAQPSLVRPGQVRS